MILLSLLYFALSVFAFLISGNSISKLFNSETKLEDWKNISLGQIIFLVIFLPATIPATLMHLFFLFIVFMMEREKYENKFLDYKPFKRKN